METFVPYLLSLNVLLLLLAGYFRLFLAKQQRFQWNRFFLLGGMAAALLMPLLPWNVLPISLPSLDFSSPAQDVVMVAAPEVIPGELVSPTTWGSSVSLDAPATAAYHVPPVAAPPAEKGWEMTLQQAAQWALALYGLGVVLALTALAWRNLRIMRLVWKGEKTQLDGCTMVTTKEDIGPASYFRYIFWNAERGLDPQSDAVALAHERCHSRQLHSLDLLGVEVLKAFCWFNPAIYLLRKDLRRTHEFLADQAALQVAGVDGIKRLLLMRQLGPRHLTIANYFHSHIKARIIMLTTTSKRKTLVHYLLMLPLAALTAACTSFAHPSDNQPTFAVVDSPLSGQPAAAERAVAASDSQRTATVTTTSFFELDDVFVRAKLPGGIQNLEGTGLVCLGAEPQTLRLDSVMSFKDATGKTIDRGEPQILNRDRITKLIGFPKEAQAQKIDMTIRMKLLVDENGRTIRHIYLDETPQVLRDAIDAHARDFSFLPGLENGKPAKWWVILPIYFGPRGC